MTEETWVNHFAPEIKRQSKQWTYSDSLPPKNVKVILRDAKWILLIGYLENGQIINGEYYANFLAK